MASFLRKSKSPRPSAPATAANWPGKPSAVPPPRNPSQPHASAWGYFNHRPNPKLPRKQRAQQSARPLLPPRLKQRQRIFLLIRVPGDFFEIQIRPQPGCLWHVYVTVDNLHRMRDDVLLPRLIELVENLVNEKIRQRRIQLHASRGTNGPLRAVRRDHAIVRVHHVRDFACGE